jgi:hypothetical protein
LPATVSAQTAGLASSLAAVQIAGVLRIYSPGDYQRVKGLWLK